MFSKGLPVALVLACAALELYALSRRNGQPSNDGLRRFIAGEVNQSVTVGQTFAPRADGLSAVTLYPRATGDQPAGEATIEVRDVTAGAPLVVGRSTRSLAELTQAGEVTIDFPPQLSSGRRYELELRVTETAPGRSLGLLATRGNGYRYGNLRVRGRNRFGDLVFNTTVTEARSNFSVIASRLAASGLPAPAVALLMLLAIKNAALYVLLRAATLAAAHPKPEPRAP